MSKVDYKKEFGTFFKARTGQPVLAPQVESRHPGHDRTRWPHFPVAPASVRMKSSPRWAQAAWETCTGSAIPGSDRTVAIKLLNAALSGDAISRERFEREARSIAALTHPHICTVHDVGDHEGHAFLVMELLEGQTLAARLARTKGGLPLDEVLSIATQLAEALAFAHRHHITHRDIKPANIMLTPTGVKLLDFGLAQLRDRDEVTGLSGTQSALTGPLGVVGTLAYMSPEQLDGRADQRSDIFAFGAVLFEMLTGRKAFDGATSSTVIGAVVHTDPPAVSSLRPEVSASLDRVARRCLAKDPDARWQSTVDLVDELKWIAGRPMPGEVTIEAPVRRVRPLLVLVATLSVALIAALIAWAPWRPAPIPPSLPETRTEIVTPATNDPTSFALSPDGGRSSSWRPATARHVSGSDRSRPPRRSRWRARKGPRLLSGRPTVAPSVSLPGAC